MIEKFLLTLLVICGGFEVFRLISINHYVEEMQKYKKMLALSYKERRKILEKDSVFFLFLLHMVVVAVFELFSILISLLLLEGVLKFFLCGFLILFIPAFLILKYTDEKTYRAWKIFGFSYNIFTLIIYPVFFY